MAAKIALPKLSLIKTIPGKLTKNLSWVFLLVLLIIIFTEGYELQGAVGLAIKSSQTQPPINKDKGVRINFDDYQKIVEHIQRGQNFQASTVVPQDPFNPAKPSVSTTTPAQ